MYPMPDFQERDRSAIVEFVRKYPLGILCAVSDSGRIEASHVPLLLSDDGENLRLRGHVMRKTSHWHALKGANDVLVAFNGPDSPVLASWNRSLRFGGTYNYMAAHMRGPITFLPEPDLVSILRELKDGYETEPAAKFDLLPADYVPSLIGAIEGFEIVVNEMDAVFKLSQNRDHADFERTIEELERRGGEAALVAAEMAARRSMFFPNQS